jgi:anion-transporting  ArsA/GET3 family ATPase
MLNELLERRAVVVVGKGGVGRTMVSGALALCAAGRGARVLVMESDLRAPMAALFGVKPSYEEVEIAANLWAMVLNGPEALQEYLGLVVPSRAVLRAVFASSLYRYFVRAAPGLRELIIIGKFFHESERRAPFKPPWDFIVLDAPASGRALDLLQMPFAARETFGEGIVGREAENVGRFLRDEQRCAIIQVTTPETLAVVETLETHAALVRLGIRPSAVVLNRASAVSFDAHDLARLARRAATRAAGLRHAEELAELARAELRRTVKTRRAEGIVRRQTKKQVIDLPECPGVSGLDLIRELAARLAGGDSCLSARHLQRKI